MLHIIIGVVAIAIGLWGIANNWYMFRDMLVSIVPLAVFCFGIVALLAGIRSLRTKWERQEEPEEEEEEEERHEDDKDSGD